MLQTCNADVSSQYGNYNIVEYIFPLNVIGVDAVNVVTLRYLGKFDGMCMLEQSH